MSPNPLILTLKPPSTRSTLTNCRWCPCRPYPPRHSPTPKPCQQVQYHKNGNKPKSVKMGFHTIDCIKLFCEVSQNPRPKVPKDIRILIMQTFHGVGHPAEKEKARRISKFYYWPRLKKDVADFTASCQPCQATKPGNIRPQVGKFPVPERGFQDIHTLGRSWPPARESRIPLLAHDPGSPHHEAIPMIEDTCKACCHCLDNGNWSVPVQPNYDWALTL